LRYFLRISYDGTRFHGWQRQLNGITIQQVLEEALSMMLRTEINLTGAGRTDTGVHAAEFYAHFDLAGPLETPGKEKLVFRLNSYLGKDIAVHAISPVNPDAHARFSAIARTYRYCIAREPDPFRQSYTWYLFGTLNLELMNRGAAMIMQTSDFTSFSKVDTDTVTNICKVSYANWATEDTELVFTITADRFLRNMVRAIVGTLVQLGRGKITLEDLKRIIDSKDRAAAGDSVPGRGLVLQRIEYPGDVFNW
jgi:tRNA pseudouridine38-40 synthase